MANGSSARAVIADAIDDAVHLFDQTGKQGRKTPECTYCSAVCRSPVCVSVSLAEDL